MRTKNPQQIIQRLLCFDEFAMLIFAYIVGFAYVLPGFAKPPSLRSAVAMQEPGSKVDMEAIGWEERTWSKRTDATTTDDGACFIVPEDESPDPAKQWFFCSEPSDDPAMQCELVPEWMGSAPDGGHAVWMCSTEPPK